MRAAQMSDVRLERANMQGVLLINEQMGVADLYRADLRNADLRKANLREADLRMADLEGAIFTGADIAGTILPHGYLAPVLQAEQNP